MDTALAITRRALLHLNIKIRFAENFSGKTPPIARKMLMNQFKTAIETRFGLLHRLREGVTPHEARGQTQETEKFHHWTGRFVNQKKVIILFQTNKIHQSGQHRAKKTPRKTGSPLQWV